MAENHSIINAVLNGFCGIKHDDFRISFKIGTKIHKAACFLVRAGKLQLGIENNNYQYFAPVIDVVFYSRLDNGQWKVGTSKKEWLTVDYDQFINSI